MKDMKSPQLVFSGFPKSKSELKEPLKKGQEKAY